jgi:hypothetical protein
MTLPPFVYSKAFWTALSFALAGILGLLAYFQVIPPEWALGGSAILAGLLAFLNLLGINPELRAKGLIK